jgi:hypothetical protein
MQIMTTTPTKTRLIHLALGLIGLATTGLSQTVNWGSAFDAPNRFYLSNGTNMAAGFPFHLGYWNAGFTPSGANATLWAANWNDWGLPSQSMLIDDFGFFGVTAAKTSTDPLLVGKQLYIWAYNNTALMGMPGGEAFMATAPTWTMPGTGIAPSVNYDLGDTSPSTVTSVIYGALDRDMLLPANGITGGAGVGVISNPRAANTFHVQSATWAAPVPEPGVTLALGLAATALTWRRRRA